MAFYLTISQKPSFFILLIQVFGRKEALIKDKYSWILCSIRLPRGFTGSY